MSDYKSNNFQKTINIFPPIYQAITQSANPNALSSSIKKRLLKVLI